MKNFKFYFFISIVIFASTLSLSARILEVKIPGSLSVLLSDNEQASLTDLKLMGVINNADFATMKSMPLLSNIDLSEVDIVAENEEKGIPHDAFRGKQTLQKIILPACVQAISFTSFTNCKALEEVDFSHCGELIAIGGGYNSAHIGAFENCESLKVLDFRNCKKLKYIGISDFYGCAKLEKVDFTGCTKLQNIDSPFSNCKALKDVYFTGCSALEIIGGNQLWGGSFKNCKSLTTVDFTGCTSLHTIGYEAFTYSTELKNIDLTPCTGLKTIDNDAFYHSGVITVSLPASCTTIGENAFCGCERLQNISLPKQLQKIYRGAFLNCTSLTSINIPNGCVEVGYEAFSSCSALTKAIVPGSVISLNGSIFEYCTLLSDVTLGNGIEEIKSNAFSNCTSLKSIILPATLKIVDGFKYTGLMSLDIPDGVTTICHDAFYSCSSLAEIELPNSIETIGHSAFSNCSALKSIHIPTQVMMIDQFTFSGCSELISITGWENVTVIEKRAFNGCSALQNVTLPSKLEKCGNDIFSFCGILESISISDENPYFLTEDGVLFNKEKTKIVCFPSGKKGEYTVPASIETIEINQFANIAFLTSLTISEGTKYIENYAFSNCKGLTYIDLPSSLETMVSNLTVDCPALKELHIRSSVPPRWSLNDPTKLKYLIYVPDGSLQAYKDNANWEPYKLFLREENGSSVEKKSVSDRFWVRASEKGVFVGSGAEKMAIRIFSSAGALIYSSSIESGQFISILVAGTYLVEYNGYVKKIVIR